MSSRKIRWACQEAAPPEAARARSCRAAPLTVRVARTARSTTTSARLSASRTFPYWVQSRSSAADHSMDEASDSTCSDAGNEASPDEGTLRIPEGIIEPCAQEYHRAGVVRW